MNPASYRNPSRICFDADQLQRHRRLSYMLQQAGYVAGELLLMLRRRFHRNPRHYRRVRAEIIAIAQWMNFLAEECEYIVTETAERRPDGVKLSWGVLCKGCREKTASATRRRGRTNAYEHLKPNPSWGAQLDFLLTCTKRVALDLFELSCESSDLKKFPECLTKLTNALLRQQRHLAHIAAKETKIEVKCGSDKCEECGQSAEQSAESVS
jgi:hypothetical protein